ncbi:MAG: rod-binding protein [Hoeflea sp.]|uniref:rod-binding protein n=1 Tax=Hoeflea sp. TaxID=1940281 RepID=UPI0032990953
MSIQTATDLILDVVKAADPAMAQKAEALLEAASIRKSGQAAATPAFENQLLASSDGSGVTVSTGPVAQATQDKAAESYQRFEAMILQNFIGSMLPSDGEELYGKGTAGEIWKGMLAEQLGSALAKGGGIGIAERMLANRFDAELKPEAANGVTSNVSNRATSLVNEVQKQIFADISANGEPVGASEQTSRGA